MMRVWVGIGIGIGIRRWELCSHRIGLVACDCVLGMGMFDEEWYCAHWYVYSCGFGIVFGLLY